MGKKNGVLLSETYRVNERDSAYELMRIRRLDKDGFD